MNGRVRAASVWVVFLLLVGLAQGALAQRTTEAASSDRPPRSPEWGTSAPIAYNVPGWTFNGRWDAQFDIDTDGYLMWTGGSNNHFVQTMQLPSGAVIQGLTLYYHDDSFSETIYFSLSRYTGTSASGFVGTTLLADQTDIYGYQGGYHALAAPETVRNVDPVTDASSMYLMDVELAMAVESISFGGVTVWYRLQTSPAPATATFSDVPTSHWAFQWIEALVASGITAGCGGGKYCPDNPITRAQMAVYLADALGLHWPDAD